MKASGILLCDELIFSSKVTGTAQALGLTVAIARTVDTLVKLVEHPEIKCVILDLHYPDLNLTQLLPRLRGEQARRLLVVGYGSHVDTVTLKAAREAGCDLVWPRSKFVEELPTALPAWLKDDHSRSPLRDGGV